MIAYNSSSLINLNIVKEAKQWLESNIIGDQQYGAIKEQHKCEFYHPNVFIRLLLFLATLIALGGVTGFLGLIFADLLEHIIEGVAIFYGIGSWLFLEAVFIRKGRHYKSGVNEAMLYHSLGWTIGGIAAAANFNVEVTALTCFFLFTLASLRYADLICTTAAFASFAYFIFDLFYSMEGVYQQIIPIVFIILFTPLYFLTRKFKARKDSEHWDACIILVEALTLLTIYAAGNYFVVRELSVALMNFYLEPGQDIPFAFLFYGLTVIIPVLYLYFGIKRKDVVLLRVSLIAVAFSVFTFKYYFSIGYPEITLTIAGAVLLTTSLYMFRYLRTAKSGFTRENLLKEKWAAANPEAFVISQTLGGNKMTVEAPADLGGGGTSGGGGSSEGW